MNKIASFLLTFPLIFSSCEQEVPTDNTYYKVSAPTEVCAQQLNMTTATFTWTDNAEDEKRYNLYIRDASSTSFDSPFTKIAANQTSYKKTDLETGKSYVFGVQAAGQTEEENSDISTVEFTMVDLEKTPTITQVTPSCSFIAIHYKVEKIAGTSPDHGLCFSKEGSPTTDDICIAGPDIRAGSEIMQVIPSAYLEQDTSYQVSAYIRNNGTLYYSTPVSVRLENEPDVPQLTWEKQNYPSLADGIEIYRTTSQLNGRNFNAWYAVADLSKVDFKTLYPVSVGAKESVETQAGKSDKCEVLINGAIFGNYNIGVIMTEGQMTQQWHGEIEGCYWADNSQLYQLTRAIIGVDINGKADAFWVGVPQQGTFLYYDKPLASVVGQAKYGKVSSSVPTKAVEWNPYYAISCGPMVLYDGKICADNKTVDGTHFYTNYECWSESGVYSAHPDRSAVGITSDGKIVLFICDGRITESQGAYMEELGPIMKSIGCIHAMNLDGGGSTGMWVKGSGMINYKDGSSWRTVKSTLGFFSR